MPKLHILVGVAGSGKSTFAQKLKSDYVILSSDEIRLNIFGNLSHQSRNDHNKVFTELKRLFQLCLSQGENIVIDATNLSRKNRRFYYEIAKSKGYEVVIDLFIKPIQELYEINIDREEYKSVIEDVVKKQYISLQIPKVGVDCDKYIFRNLDKEAMAWEIATTGFQLKSISHDSPYHIESIDKHISDCISESSKISFNCARVALYHDLGKLLTMECKDESLPEVQWYNNVYRKGLAKWKTFHNHANIGAMYALVMAHDTQSDVEIKDNNIISESIFHHMNFDINNKYINKHNITSDELELIKTFQKIDKASSQADKNALEKIAEIRKERGEKCE